MKNGIIQDHSPALILVIVLIFFGAWETRGSGSIGYSEHCLYHNSAETLYYQQDGGQGISDDDCYRQADIGGQHELRIPANLHSLVLLPSPAGCTETFWHPPKFI